MCMAECVAGMCPIMVKRLLKHTQIYRIKINHHTLAQGFSNLSMHVNPLGIFSKSRFGFSMAAFPPGAQWDPHCWRVDHILSTEGP